MHAASNPGGGPRRGARPGRRVLITGVAGFIGYHLIRTLCHNGWDARGLDNFDPYYDVSLKRARMAALHGAPNCRVLEADCTDADALQEIFAAYRPDYVVHLAGQPGVRYSVENPAAYTRANLVGFSQVLEACRRFRPCRLLFASSSSVYGNNAVPPFREDAPVEAPVSYYSATKRANELMAASYATTYGLEIVGMRFFSVYGPWGRPDMAPSLFARAICEGAPIKLFNEGRNLRDFTYIDDIVAGIIALLQVRPVAGAPYQIFNLGHNRPVETRAFVELLERVLGRRSEKVLLPPQAGDVFQTCADLERVHAAVGYVPAMPLETGLERFAAWFKGYYGYGVADSRAA